MNRVHTDARMGEPVQAPPLRILFWESTSLCNLSCVHCRRLDTAEQAAQNDLSTDQVRAVLDSAANLGSPVVVFSGGEPLMRSDWRELADYARKLALPTALATNGTLIDSATADDIAAAGFRRVSVSLDGANADVHDRFRGVAGAFDAAMAGIAELCKANVPFQVNATIAAHNIAHCDELYNLARSLGAVALHLFLLVPVGCGTQIAESHRISPAEYEGVLNWVLDKHRDDSFEIRATCAPHIYRLAENRGISLRGSRGCMCGLSVVFVSHQGEVFPCGYLPVSCGSVREQPLAEIWQNSNVLHSLRDFDKLTGKCGQCAFRDVCGGCRARAFAASGDYLAADPTCKYAPHG